MCRGTTVFAAVTAVWLMSVEAQAQDTGALRTDSAGVEVVLNSGGSWTQGQRWQVASEPSVSIGTVTGDPRYELYRAWDALRLSSGTIVVANVGTQELRFYDADGRYVRSAGGAGEGPGEFRGLRSITRILGDSILAFDESNRRITVLDAQGRLARTATLLVPEAPVSHPWLLGSLPDGTLLVRLTHVYRAGPEERGLRREPFRYLLYRPTGEPLDEIGEFPGPELYVELTDRSSSVIGLPFGRNTYATAGAGYIYIGSSDGYEIRQYDRTGRLLRLVRRDVEPAELQREHVERFVEERLSGIEDANRRRDQRRKFRGLPYPKTLPVFEAVVAGEDGSVWVKSFSRLAEGQHSTWSVFDSTGTFLGDVELPARLTPRDIGSDYILGAEKGDLDIEYIRVYRVVKR